MNNPASFPSSVHHPSFIVHHFPSGMVKSHGAMNILLLTVRVLLSAVFTVAAVTKLSDRRGTERAITDLGLPQATAPLLARVVPFVELAVALMLLPAATAWRGGVAAF